jgi:hypothetical protein
MIAKIFATYKRARTAFDDRPLNMYETKCYGSLTVKRDDEVIEAYVVQGEELHGLYLSAVHFDESSKFSSEFIRHVQSRVRA